MYNKELTQKLDRCAAACDYCLEACLNEEDIKKLVECIKLDRDSAKICRTTASLIASGSRHAEGFVKKCEEICRLCAEECEKHEMDHCQDCARACRECEEACKDYAGAAAV